ncbi:MAG: CotH kinase family protein [Clostridia bacterium]|nr:CotH kinase family protein [Clostridia bacterium]
MVKFMKKLIPVLIILVFSLTVLLLFGLIDKAREHSSDPTPDVSALLIEGTPGPSDTGEPSDIPAETATPSPSPTPSPTPTDTPSPTPTPTPTPEPTFCAVIAPKLSGESSELITLSVTEDCIEAKYPFSENEASLSKLKLSIGGDDIGSIEYQREGFSPWVRYPVKITDSQGLDKEYSFRLIPKGNNLPVVSIYTDAPVKNRIDYVTGRIYISGDNTESYAGMNIEGAGLKIRGRGNASWDQTDKKSYRLKLDEKASVLGLDDNRDWVLVSNHFDKSLLRNVVAHTLAQQMDYLYYTPTHILVDYFMNGKYMGVYAICDKIEEAKSKVDIYNGTDPDEPGFMIEIGWDYSKTNVRDRDYFDTSLLIRLFVKEPDIPKANSPEMLYIKDFFKKTEQAVLAGEGYEEYIDVDNMVDWFIIAELTNNTEMAFYRSCYLYKPEGGKITMGPVWDFDMAFGNHEGDIPGYNGWATAEATYSYVNDTWTTYLVKDPKFMEKVKARWIEVREKLLDVANATIDSQYALVKDSADLNFELWDILDKKVGIGTVDCKVYNTYEKQVEYVRTFIINRAAYIDKRLGVNG